MPRRAAKGHRGNKDHHTPNSILFLFPLFALYLLLVLCVKKAPPPFHPSPSVAFCGAARKDPMDATQCLNPSPPGSNIQHRLSFSSPGGFVDWLNVGQAKGRLSLRPHNLSHLLSGADQTQMGESTHPHWPSAEHHYPQQKTKALLFLEKFSVVIRAPKLSPLNGPSLLACCCYPFFLLMLPPSPPPTHIPHTKPCIHLLGTAVLQLGQNGDINVFLWFFLGKSLIRGKKGTG